MKLGLLTDIHEASAPLQLALERLQQEQVDRIIFLGDLFELGENIAETCRLMAEAGVVGVWGNHDLGLCFDVSDEIRQKYPDSALDYTATLKPRLVLTDCYFSHVEPWLNPEKIEDLWFFEGPPDEHDRLERIFTAVPQRFMFAGHYHQWMVVTPQGITDWSGTAPIQLETGRYFVVVNALCRGHFATFDTDTTLLTPHRVGNPF